MNANLIRYFNKALAEDGAEKNFKKVNEKSIPMGYIIQPACCTPDVVKFLIEEDYNPNSTFYKTWEEITSKTRFELFIDQVMHYASTYGTNYEGKTYLPNAAPEVLPFKAYKVIKSASKEEIFEDCLNMLQSGVALKSETINDLLEYIVEYGFLGKVDIDSIKNKEAQTIISLKLGILPKEPISMLRTIVYQYTNSAMLIKSNQVIETIKENDSKKVFEIDQLTYEQLKTLSSIFYRFKPIFLAMKNRRTASTINKIRRYAVKYHKPMQVGFWEKILSTPKEKQDLTLKLAEGNAEDLNNFKKIQLMQGIKERLASKSIEGRMFVIRNGKFFVRKGYKAPCDMSFLMRLYTILEKSVIKFLKTKSTVLYQIEDGVGSVQERPFEFKMPKYLNITAPSSEKNFVGNYPLGTSVKMSNTNNVIGIYWRNEWGTRDFDLHYLDLNGTHYGWNSAYTSADNDIIFSGDMVNADPEACEMFYVEKKVQDGIISVNKYNGDEKSKLKLFVARHDYKEGFAYHSKKDYERSRTVMVDPNDIVFEAMLDFSDQFEKKIALIKDNRIYLMDFNAGDRRVSNATANSIIQQQFILKADCFVDLRELLKAAGFKEYNEQSDYEPDMDFTNPSKDSLLKLFS